MNNTITKQADSILNQWGDLIRSGNYFTLDAKISSIYLTSYRKILKLDENVLNEVDHIVGEMDSHVQRVIKRYYIDCIPEKRNVFYRKDIRTIELKAITEDMSPFAFKDFLRIGRFIVHQKLKDLRLIT